MAKGTENRCCLGALAPGTAARGLRKMPGLQREQHSSGIACIRAGGCASVGAGVMCMASLGWPQHLDLLMNTELSSQSGDPLICRSYQAYSSTQGLFVR